MISFTKYIKESEIYVWFMIGIQGSGKSTWVGKNSDNFGDFVYLNADSYREELQKEKNFKFNHSNPLHQKEVFKRLYEDMDKAIKNEKNIVLDMMNLNSKRRKTEIKKIKEKTDKKIKFIAVYFPPNVKESINRIKKSRNKEDINYVSDEIIKSCAERIQPPSKLEGFDKIIKIEY